MKFKLSFYNTTSIAKIILWAAILLITYTSINVYEDPIVAISLCFLWIFILARWISFFLFLFEQRLFHKLKSEEWIKKDSYKLSLLFWIFCIINVLLILWSHRNKLIWIILLIVFILMQIFLFERNDWNWTN